MAYTTYIRHGYVNHTCLYIYAKTQPTLTSTLYVISKYLPQTNILTKLYTDAKYLIYIYGVVTTYEVTCMNATRNTVHIFDIYY